MDIPPSGHSQGSNRPSEVPHDPDKGERTTSDRRTVNELTPLYQIRNEHENAEDIDHTSLNERETKEWSMIPSFLSPHWPFSKFNTSPGHPTQDNTESNELSQPSTFRRMLNVPIYAIGLATDTAGNLTSRFSTAISNQSSNYIDQFIAKKIGLELLEAEKKNWSKLLRGVLLNYVNMLGDEERQEYLFRKALLTRPDNLPIKIENLEFDLLQVPKGIDGVLIQDQKLKNHFIAKHIRATIEIPTPDSDTPIVLNINLHDVAITLATGLRVTNIPQIIRGAEHHPEDKTVLQLEAGKVDIQFSDVDIETTMPDELSESPSIDSSMVRINSGHIVMEKFHFSKPINIFKESSEQTSAMSYKSFSMTKLNSGKPCLVDLNSVHVYHGDDKQNGEFSCELKINTKRLSGVSYIGKFIAYLFSKPMTIKFLVPMREGEIHFKDIKHCLHFSGNRFLCWMFNHAIKSPDTKLISGEQGTQLQIGWPIKTVIPKFDIEGAIAAKPVATALMDEDHISPDNINSMNRVDGYFIVPEIISDKASKILNKCKYKSHPLRVIPEWLKKLCSDAAKGDNDEASLQLLEFVRKNEQNEHQNEYLMALQAIPPDFYQRYISKAKDAEWAFIERQAHKILVADKEKSLTIYQSLLQKKNIYHLADTKNPLWLIDIAKQLIKKNPNDAINILEFAYKYNPENSEEALALLKELHSKKQYTEQQAKNFLHTLTTSISYFQAPENRTLLLNTFNTMAPAQVRIELLDLPIAPLIENLNNHDIQDSYVHIIDIINTLKALYLNHDLNGLAAELMAETRQTREAISILNKAINEGKTDALKVRLKLGLNDKGQEDLTPRSECLYLLSLIESPKTKDNIKKASIKMLAELIQSSPPEVITSCFIDDINLPELNKNLFSTHLHQLSTINISENLYADLLFKKLDHVREGIKKSLIEDRQIKPNNPNYIAIKAANKRIKLVIELIDHIQKTQRPWIDAAKQYLAQNAPQKSTDPAFTEIPKILDESLTPANTDSVLMPDERPYESFNSPASTNNIEHSHQNLTPNSVEISRLISEDTSDDEFCDAHEVMSMDEEQPGRLLSNQTSELISAEVESEAIENTPSKPDSLFGGKPIYSPSKQFLSKELQEAYKRNLIKYIT